VLVVEDDDRSRASVRIALQGIGCDVLEAADAASALLALEAGAPDLVVLDLLLPDIEGLALAARIRRRAADTPIVAVSGWRERLESDEAAAAGFAARLLKPVEPSRLVDVVRRHVAVHDAPADGKARIVVLADDDPVQLKLCSLRLEAEGFAVVQATDGMEAVELTRRHRPVAVVSDVLMPRMDGFDVARTLRQDPALDGLRIVLASSAYVEEADRRLAADAGADRFVVREPDMTALIDALYGALSAGSWNVAADDAYEALHTERLTAMVAAREVANLRLADDLRAARLALAVTSEAADALARDAVGPGALARILATALREADLVGLALHLADGTIVRAGLCGTPDPESIDIALRTGRTVVAGARTVVRLRHGAGVLGVAVLERDEATPPSALDEPLAGALAHAVALWRDRQPTRYPTS